MSKVFGGHAMGIKRIPKKYRRGGKSTPSSNPKKNPTDEVNPVTTYFILCSNCNKYPGFIPHEHPNRVCDHCHEPVSM